MLVDQMGEDMFVNRVSDFELTAWVYILAPVCDL